MPRLGDLLVQAGVVNPDEVEDAARAQVAYGGRIGTNLVELDSIEIDELAVFLGRQHRLPAARRENFEKADASLQALLKPEVAARYGVIPLTRIAGKGRRVAIASLGPLSPEAITLVAATLGCDEPDLVVGVAPELRILYNLEKVYGIARPSRFLRTRRGGTTEMAIVPIPDGDSDDEIAIPEPAEDEVTTPVAEPDAVLELVPAEPPAELVPADLVPAESAPAAPPEPVEPAGAERRRFVRTVDDPVPPPAHPVDPGSTSLGRINLRKLAVSAAALDDSGAGRAGVASALRAIRRCRDREQLGALAIDVLDKGAGEAVDAGALFIARGPVAVVWRGFARDAEVDFDQLAVPLDQPSVIAREPGTAIRRVDADHPATPLDERLIAALGFEPPTFVVAVPVAIRDHVIGFVYAKGRGDALAVERLAGEIAEATRAALTSLLRAAQR